MTSQPTSYSDRRGKTVYLLFNRPIFWLLDGQNRTRLKWASWYLRLSTPPECPSPFMRAITRTAINLHYFSCTLGDYLSYNLVLVQRQLQSWVCEEALLVGGIFRLLSTFATGSLMVANLTLAYQNFHTKP